MTVVALGEVVTFIRGVSYDGADATSSPRPDALPILRAGNIRDRLEIDRDLVWVPRSSIARVQLLVPGDIVMCMSSGSPSVVGKSALLDDPFEGSVGAFCGILRLGPLVDSQYLAWWLRSTAFRSWRDSQARGASIQNLRFSELGRLEINLPELDEQHRAAAWITGILSTAERARTHAAQQGEHARLLRDNTAAAVLQRATPHRRVPIGRLGALVDGDWILNSDYETAGVRLLQVGDVGRGTLVAKSNRFISEARAAELNCTRLARGDILISRMPDPIGRACLVPDLGYPAITAVDVTIFRPDTTLLDPRYAVQYMNSQAWLRAAASKASGATRARISRSNLELLEIPIPGLREQRLVASLLEEVLRHADTLKANIGSRAKALDDLRSAVLSRAFSEGAVA